MIPDTLLPQSNFLKRLEAHPEMSTSEGYQTSPELSGLLNDQALVLDQRMLSTMYFHHYPLGFSAELISELTIDHTINRLVEQGAFPENLRMAFVKNKHVSSASLVELMAKMRAHAALYHISISFDDVLHAESEYPEWIICASAVGPIHPKCNLNSKRINKGDKLIVSGVIGGHGLSMKNHHGELEDHYDVGFNHYAAHRQIATLLHDFGVWIKDIRMPFYGLSIALDEMSELTGLKMELFQSKVPVLATIKHLAQLNDLNPVDLANEGVFICVVGQQKAHEVVNKLKTLSHGRNAAIIGEVSA